MIKAITPKDFQFKTEPYDHQFESFMLARDTEAFGQLMEMGTGKTKVTIDDAAWNFAKGRINFMLIAAPNDVHRNWIDRELPKHLPDWVEHRTCVWSSRMKKADWEDFWKLFDPEFTGLRILAVNFEAFSAQVRIWNKRSENKLKPTFHEAIKSILNSFNVFWAVDESSKIKTPGSKRTARICKLGEKAKVRRILTGTLGDPLETYAQFLFLSPDILGYTNFFSYKHRYAEWERRILKNGRGFMELKGFCRIDELNAKITAHSYRVLKKDCLDLPDKIYKRRPLSFTPEQKRIYGKLKDQSILELNREDTTVANVLVKYLRLQQVIGGWLPNVDVITGEALPTVSMFDKHEDNPRIKAMLDVIDENAGQSVIIWARFRGEIEAITEILNARQPNSAVSFYGGTAKEDRADAIDGFESGKYKYFVAQQHSGGYGLTLVAATLVIYYSNDFSLEARLQSEDRCHRIGQTNKVLYVDLEVDGTVDTRILAALLSKKSLADTVVGDDPSAWF